MKWKREKENEGFVTRGKRFAAWRPREFSSPLGMTQRDRVCWLKKVVDPFKGNLFIARLSFLPAFVRSERSKGSISNDSYTSKFKIHEQRTPELPGVRVKKVDLRIGKT